MRWIITGAITTALARESARGGNGMNTKNNVDFGSVFTELYYSRMDNPEILEQLENNEKYIEAMQARDELLEGILEAGNIDESALQELKDGFRALHDIELHFAYRLGVQDGFTMQSPEFRTLVLNNKKKAG
jgi:hypothetical protein